MKDLLKNLAVLACAASAWVGSTARGQTPDPQGTPVPALLASRTTGLPDGEQPSPPPMPETTTMVTATAPASYELPACPAACDGKLAWGVAGARLVYAGTRMAPNGVPFDPIFSLDLDFNIWLWRAERLYAFTESRFWGQRTAPGIADPGIDFSKREFDFNFGAAWNYCGAWEARFFAYSLANLNRGNSLAEPFGFKDGIGVENRLYLGATYADLGSPGYDQTRANFLSVGFLPSKSLVGGLGEDFSPSVFARAYLTHDLWTSACYGYLDTTFMTERPLTSKLVTTDAGVALRPFRQQQQWEFRAGCENVWDTPDGTSRPLGYLSARLVY